MTASLPRLVIAGLSGDSGKTIVSLSVLAALRKKGMSVAPFKKGPDYIDAAWLGWAAGGVCRNLDTYLVDSDTILKNFVSRSSNYDIVIIEGNRGIFDGRDIEGTHSTASLAKLLQSPVILVVDCSKVTRTTAAVIKGCVSFDPEVNIAGVILNRIAGDRHQKIITESIKRYCNLPVLGAIPGFGDQRRLIPERHLGLIPPLEFLDQGELEKSLSSIADDYLDIDGLISVAKRAGSLAVDKSELEPLSPVMVKIGYFSDSVFTFYYPENLEALSRHGAELVKISSLDDKTLPDIDALYIGGGFPETHAERLARNTSLRDSVKVAAERGLPIYAECGGLIYLSKSLTWEGRRYPMADVLPVDLIMNSKPAGHGYAEIEVDRPNPVFPLGAVIHGHEFHYSSLSASSPTANGCMKVKSGVGLGGKRDGIVYKSILACYIHIHADGITDWAPAMIRNARDFRSQCRNTSADKMKNDKFHKNALDNSEGNLGARPGIKRDFYHPDRIRESKYN